GQDDGAASGPPRAPRCHGRARSQSARTHRSTGRPERGGRGHPLIHRPPIGKARMANQHLRGLTPDSRPPDEQPRWRQDFPINTAEDNYVARRDFTKFMVLISASFVAGQGWIALKTLSTGEARGRHGPRAIARVSDLAVGQAVVFSYPEEHDTCLLVRAGE